MEIELKNIYAYIWAYDGYWTCPTMINAIKNTKLSEQAKKSIRAYLKKEYARESPADVGWQGVLWKVQDMYPKEKIYFPDKCICPDKSCTLSSSESDSDE